MTAARMSSELANFTSTFPETRSQMRTSLPELTAALNQRMVLFRRFPRIRLKSLKIRFRDLGCYLPSRSRQRPLHVHLQLSKQQSLASHLHILCPEISRQTRNKILENKFDILNSICKDVMSKAIGFGKTQCSPGTSQHIFLIKSTKISACEVKRLTVLCSFRHASRSKFGLLRSTGSPYKKSGTTTKNPAAATLSASFLFQQKQVQLQLTARTSIQQEKKELRRIMSY